MISGSARALIHERLQGLWLLSPQLADQLEQATARRLEFLASKMPQRPPSRALQVGPDRWHPPELEMRKWARYVSAASDPDGVLDRLASGAMTPEDAETMRVLYPATWEEMQRQVFARLPELRASLPYAKRVMMSYLFDAPVDPAMDPTILGILQSSPIADMAAIGMGSPRANPSALGKSGAPTPTPSQRMSAGL